MKGERAVILLYLAGLHQHQVGDIAPIQGKVGYLPALHEAANGTGGGVDGGSDRGHVHLRRDTQHGQREVHFPLLLHVEPDLNGRLLESIGRGRHCISSYAQTRERIVSIG